MKYLDPKRPSVNGFPMLLRGAVPLCAMPYVYLGPSPGGTQVTLCVHLPLSDNSFRAFYAVVGNLNTFWNDWMEDPEQCLEILFSYRYEAQHAPQARPPRVQNVVSDLSDLGLE